MEAGAACALLIHHGIYTIQFLSHFSVLQGAVDVLSCEACNVLRAILNYNAALCLLERLLPYMRLIST